MEKIDYKELIDELRRFTYWLGQSGPESHDMHPIVCDKAAIAIEILLAEAGTKWISVDERLPELYTPVIIYRSSGIVEQSCLAVDGKWNCPGGGGYGARAIYWMPFPEPPDG